MVHLTKKIIGQFFIRKNTKPGGWSREVWQITTLFRIIFVKPSLIKSTMNEMVRTRTKTVLCESGDEEKQEWQSDDLVHSCT